MLSIILFSPAWVQAGVPLEADGTVPGKPFQVLHDKDIDLQNQIDAIELTPGPKGDSCTINGTVVSCEDGTSSDVQGPQGVPGADGADSTVPGPPGPAVEQQIGTKVAPGLFEVHSRVLWDIGWMDPSNLEGGGFFTFYEDPKPLVYALNQTLFLGPLKSGIYGIPAVQAGATRKVRLYVNYGHQWECGGTVTVRIGGVDFSLPGISGFYGTMAAGWSDYRSEADYGHFVHAGIQVFMKDFVFLGSQCGPFPGTGPGRPKGAMYRIEAHYYDEFPP